MNNRPAALVTGASRGLGQALVLRLAERGHPVVLVAREGEPLHDVVTRIRAQGGRLAHAVVGDLGRPDDARSIAAQATALVGRVGLLVHNASTLPASLRVRTGSGRVHELRVATPGGPTGWWVVLLGEGDWRTPTERRPLPEMLDVDDAIALPDGTHARVLERSHRSPITDHRSPITDHRSPITDHRACSRSTGAATMRACSRCSSATVGRSSTAT